MTVPLIRSLPGRNGRPPRRGGYACDVNIRKDVPGGGVNAAVTVDVVDESVGVKVGGFLNPDPANPAEAGLPTAFVTAETSVPYKGGGGVDYGVKTGFAVSTRGGLYPDQAGGVLSFEPTLGFAAGTTGRYDRAAGVLTYEYLEGLGGGRSAGGAYTPPIAIPLPGGNSIAPTFTLGYTDPQEGEGAVSVGIELGGFTFGKKLD